MIDTDGTRNINDILQWISINQNKYIFISSTYKSCDIIYQLCELYPEAFIIIDEFHNMTKNNLYDENDNLYKIINGQKFLNLCITKISNNFFCSSDLELGFMVLFSFDYLYLAHNCISEFIETGKISENNNSLIELKKLLF